MITAGASGDAPLGRVAERLSVLSRAMRSFAEATTEPRLLVETIARCTGEALGSCCAMGLVSEDGEWLERVARFGADAPTLDLEERLAIGRSLRLDADHPLARCLASGEPALADGTVLFVPLRSRGKSIGAFSLVRHGEHAKCFEDDDVKLAECLAEQAALALTTERLQSSARRALEEQNDRTRTEEVLRRGLLESAPDAMVILGKDGRIALVNAQTEALFGYSREELSGQPIEILIPERFRAAHPQKREGYVEAPKPRPMGAGLDLFGRRKDGTEFAAEISLSPIETPEGTLVTAAIRDVTERKRDMEEQNRRMQEANRFKSEFLANMSHELRTPLNAIIGFAALMHGGRAGAISDVHKEYLGDILTSSRHLLQLINDVLDLAKVESGRLDLHLETIDIASIVREVKDILRGLAAEKRVRFSVELDRAMPEVTADPRMLKQVLYNFLSNAIKFTPEAGDVRLRIGPSGDSEFRIDVEDTGIGIKPEDIKRLFVEFQQLDASAAKKYPGTGLGLALTKRIVEAQGGRVTVESVPGRGSTFSALMPRTVK